MLSVAVFNSVYTVLTCKHTSLVHENMYYINVVGTRVFTCSLLFTAEGGREMILALQAAHVCACAVVSSAAAAHSPSSDGMSDC